MLLLTILVATFSQGLVVISSCKATISRVYGLNKLDFKTQGTTEFITLRPLVAPERSEGATAQGLRVINSVDPCVLKSNLFKHQKNMYYKLLTTLNQSQSFIILA